MLLAGTTLEKGSTKILAREEENFEVENFLDP